MPAKLTEALETLKPKSAKLTEALEALKPREPTKQDLYAEAQLLDIEGRSKMNKGALKAAIKRHRK